MKTNIFLSWLPIAAIITVIFGTVYTAVQQDIRQTANDLQVQLVEDTAVLLGQGVSPQILLGGASSINYAQSVSPFAIIFDKDGKLVGTSGDLNGAHPMPPAGVFDYARAHAEDRFTWQPQPGVRVAAVLEYYHATSTGYVLIGKNLREVEKKESHTGAIVFVGWIVSILISIGMVWIKNRRTHAIL